MFGQCQYHTRFQYIQKINHYLQTQPNIQYIPKSQFNFVLSYNGLVESVHVYDVAIYLREQIF